MLEGSLIGVALLVLSVWGGGLIDHSAGLRGMFDHAGPPLALAVIVYGWCAAILPVWLLLAPRDYLSTFLKLGVVAMLAVAIVISSFLSSTTTAPHAVAFPCASKRHP